MSGEREYLPRLETWRCWVCGGSNDHGLRLRFYSSGGGRVATEFTIADYHVGVDGVAHGGILATVFDDVMAWTLIQARGEIHFTVEMAQQFLRPVPAGRPLVAEGTFIGATDETRFDVEARLWERDRPERVLATAWGRYAEVPEAMRRQLPPDQVAEFAKLAQRLKDQST